MNKNDYYHYTYAPISGLEERSALSCWTQCAGSGRGRAVVVVFVREFMEARLAGQF